MRSKYTSGTGSSENVCMFLLFVLIATSGADGLNMTVAKVRNAKFLGVVIYDTISREHHIQALQCKVSTNVGILYRTASKLGTRESYTIYCTCIVLLAALCYSVGCM